MSHNHHEALRNIYVHEFPCNTKYYTHNNAASLAFQHAAALKKKLTKAIPIIIIIIFYNYYYNYLY